MPYVTNRWLGGMLTNWRTIRGRINELERLERMRDHGDFERITKKEALLLTREIDRLEILLGGIRSLTKVPNLLFVVDVHREETAIHEANLLNIPVIALVDTNCDPRNVDYVIPSNDDAIRAIKLLVGKMADAALEGRAMRKEEDVETLAGPSAPPPATTASSPMKNCSVRPPWQSSPLALPFTSPQMTKSSSLKAKRNGRRSRSSCKG